MTTKATSRRRRATQRAILAALGAIALATAATAAPTSEIWNEIRSIAAAQPAANAGGLLSTDGFPARWTCGTAWTPLLGWAHIISDCLIWLSYMAIPVLLAFFMLRRREVPFPAVGWLFVAFIFLCGTGHLVDAAMFYWPAYRALAVIKVGTALVSVATALALIPVIPQALTLPRMAKVNAQLTAEIDARRRTDADLKRTIANSTEANREIAFQKFALDQAAIVAITDAKGRITDVNHKFCQISRYSREDLIGQDHRIINSGFHPKSFFTELYRTITSGEVWHGEICNRTKDGDLYWVDTTIVPFRDAHGDVSRYVAIRTDITERKKAEAALENALEWKDAMLQRERTLIRELEHRVRNNLTGLLGLTAIYERSGKTTGEVAEALRGKIRAMLHVHELMSPDPGGPIDLATLIRRIAEQTGGPDWRDPLTMEGPPIELRPKAAGAIAMIVQELFTNAAKHGALAAPDGRVSITWSPAGQPDRPGLDLVWVEHWPERPLREEKSEGVGLKLIRGLSASELRGSAEFEVDSKGLRCTIRARLDREIAVQLASKGPAREDHGDHDVG